MRPASDFRQASEFWASFHSIVTLRASWYAPPDTGVPNLQLVSVEYLPSIEGALEIQMNVTFLRGKAPPIRGKYPEGTKGVGMLSPKVTERLLQICGDLSVSASPSHLPWEGRPWGTHSNGFPYEMRINSRNRKKDDKRRKKRDSKV